MQKQRAKGQRESIFNNEVVSRFELYNSLFLTLPFYKVKDTGTLLPLFIKYCEDGINNHQTPATIIDAFFKKYTQNNSNKDIIDLLFRFIQYIERQVVLFDAVEDASFNKLNAADEHNALLSYLKKGIDNKALNDKIEKLIDEFSLRLVLTAHPTQFYPGSVLSIITDLTTALKTNDISTINLLLQQLGKTPFFNKKSPTPVDEALSLAWYLENVFYFAAANIQSEIDKSLNDYNLESKKIIELGFWPGGDRDGNPNVHTDSTIQVSKMLRQILFRCYYRDFRNLKRRITFRGVEEHIAIVQDVLYKNAFDPNIETENIADFLIENLNNIRATLMDDHDGLFADLASDLIRKVELYGSHFASLDIRQDSRVLRDVHVSSAGQLQTSTAKFVLLGIPEDIGVRANYGIAGASTAWQPALKALLNIQSTPSFKGDELLVLGHFEFSEPADNSISGLQQKVAEIDDLVYPVVQKIVEAGKIPIVIGGGHNNAFPIMKGISKALNRPVDVLNIDAHVTTFTNGNDALEAFGKEHFDLVFLDENMPGLSGLETLTAIKNIRNDVPVVLITKSEEENLMEDAIGSKIDDYLIKPVNPKQVLLTIKKIIDNKRLVSEKTSMAYQQDFRRLGMP